MPASERADALAREAEVLRLLEGTAIPAPRPIAVSDGAATGGVAALLMTRVPGRIDLSPSDPRAWIRQMAETLCAIQQLDFAFPSYEPSKRRSPDDLPVWAERPKIWREALEILQRPPPPTSQCFTHGDFQHFNLLWSRRRLSGVVDRVYPVRSSPDLDVGHCALNLTILYGVERATAFRLAYEAAAGRAVEPWWDLHRLTGYGPEWREFIPRQVARRIPVDTAGMTHRVETAMAHALARM
jgi:aminoglycoside phosphotransferase (APT) family kinase protein